MVDIVVDHAVGQPGEVNSGGFGECGAAVDGAQADAGVYGVCVVGQAVQHGCCLFSGVGLPEHLSVEHHHGIGCQQHIVRLQGVGVERLGLALRQPFGYLVRRPSRGHLFVHIDPYYLHRVAQLRYQFAAPGRFGGQQYAHHFTCRPALNLAV